MSERDAIPWALCKCGYSYDADKFPSCPAVHSEEIFRIESQRKEIERLRIESCDQKIKINQLTDEALARNAIIGKLQADKVALKEMLMRTREYIEAIDGMNFADDDAMLKRISEFLERIS
jgi:hypothetical protein